MTWDNLITQPVAAGACQAWRQAGREDGVQAVVLLHGIGSGSGSWLQVIDALPKIWLEEHRILAWDMPGYGGSDALTDTHPKAAAYVERLEQWLDTLGIQQAQLVGHSLGAIIAGYARQHNPQRYTSLVLANPALGYGSKPAAERTEIHQRRAAMIADGAEVLAETRHRGLLSESASTEQLETVKQEMSRTSIIGYQAASWLLANGDLPASLEAEPGGVVAVITSVQDTITPMATAQQVAALTQAPVKVIEDAGHASYIQQPQVFADLLCHTLGPKNDI